MKPLVHPAQAAWLAEIGVDLHWLDVQAPGAHPTVSATAPSGVADIAAPLATQVVRSSAVNPVDTLPDTQAESLAQAATDSLQTLAADLKVPGRQSRVPSPEAAPTAIPVQDVVLPEADLAQLANLVTACQRCPRHLQRLRAVPGAGAERPHYLIVAEQPSLDDEISGKPFQGDSGRLLAAMLAAVQLPDAHSVYQTYVVKCRAPGGAEPAPAEVAACVLYLQREIALLKPRWILALGRMAAQAVLSTQAPLDSLRGKPHMLGLEGQSIPVWVMHQPASLLVRSALKAEAWHDLLALRTAVNQQSAGV
ncbi:uracil-DNA glycosylase [Castellaniella sp.]|uniref:uracil-DNA glycosylase n=1 Tax=Castellaniella sp. TaxID=1955812 RepID=UPI003A8F6191